MSDEYLANQRENILTNLFFYGLKKYDADVYYITENISTQPLM